MFPKNVISKIDDYTWEIPKSFRSDMRVPARVIATENMLDEAVSDRSLEQLVNIAALPGVVKYALAMPDVHEGYGAPIGGVFATDPENDGVISPGAIGYDCNCGVRLLTSRTTYEQVKDKIKDLALGLFNHVPSGLGKGGKIRLTEQDFDKVLEKGAEWAVSKGYGNKEDLKVIEENGRKMENEPEKVSKRAKNRGRDQLGTIGSGNHFVEVQKVAEIYDGKVAETFGLFPDQITILIHTGSRGTGHQIATDYINVMLQAMPKYGIEIPDRELSCAPFKSPEGQDYYLAHGCAINFAFANRQIVAHLVREVWEKIIGGELQTLYEVAHNIGKVENGLVVHRKGATRSFDNQPVLVPGSMGTASYVLVGTKKAEGETFGSTCHGAGRRMSRAEAKRKVRGDVLQKELAQKGITVVSDSLPGIAEEAPLAYKDVNEVVEVVHQAGISKKVAKLKPLGVIKGG